MHSNIKAVGYIFDDQETSTKTKQWSLAWRPPTLHYITFILQVDSIFQVHINEGNVNSLAVTSVLR